MVAPAPASNTRVHVFKALTRENYLLVIHSMYASLYAFIAIANTSSNAENSLALRLMGVLTLLGTPIVLAHILFCVISIELPRLTPFMKIEPILVFGVLLVRDVVLITLSAFAPTLSFPLAAIQSIPLIALSAIGLLKSLVISKKD